MDTNKLLIILMLSIFLSLSVSALEWDNCGQYNPETKTMKIKNACPVGIDWFAEDIADVTLVSNLHVEVGAGYQLVQEWGFDSKKGYQEAIKSLISFDINDDKKKRDPSKWKEIEQQYDLKIKNVTYETIPVYIEGECNQVEDEIQNYTNGTIFYHQECEQIQNGTETKEIINWIPINNNGDLPKGEFNVGVFTEVKVGDYVELIPTLMGIEIEEWSSWSQSLNVNLLLYYNMDEQDTSGSGTIIDSLGIYNATNGGTDNSTGKIKTGYFFNIDNTDYMTIPTVTGTSDDSLTFNSWVKSNGEVGTSRIFNHNSGGSEFGFALTATGVDFYSNDGVSSDYFAPTNSTYIDSEWVMITIIMDTVNDIKIIYMNGTEIARTDSANFVTPSSWSSVLGAKEGSLTTENFNGNIDEFSIWKRRLSASEITQLYNDYDGISYTDIFGTVPIVTLISPANDTTIDSNGYSADFIAYVTDAGSDIDNCTLSIWNITDDTLEYTQTDDSITNNTNITFSQSLMPSNYTWNINCINNESFAGESDNNWTINIISIPNNPPVVALAEPVNDTTISSNGYSASFIAHVTDIESDIDNCTLSVWNITDNTLEYTQTDVSIINNTNVTFSQTLIPSNYTWNINCLDNESAEGIGENNWTINIIPILDAPTVTLNYPIGGISINDDFVDFNFTIAAGEVNTANWTFSVWFSNGTLQHQHQNLTFNISGTETIIHNDTLFFDENYIWNVESCSSLGTCVTAPNETFSVDTLTPQPTIISPANESLIFNALENITVNFTIDHPTGTLDNCWTNTSEDSTIVLTDCATNVTYVTYDSSQPNTFTIFFYVNDTAGNTGTDNVTLIKSTIDPIDNITSPEEGYLVTEFNESIDLNWTIETDGTSDKCWYNIGSGNVFVTCGDNTTVFNYPVSNPDSLTINFSSNDTLGNMASDNVIINKSTVDPIVNITSPEEGFIVTEFNESIDLNWTIETDGTLDTCWYNIGSGNVFVTCGDNTTVFNYPVSNPDSLSIAFFSNDTLGNMGSDNVTIFKTDAGPTIDITSPVPFYSILLVGQNMSLNFTVTNVTTLEECWYEYNNINTTVACNIGSTIFIYADGEKTLTVYSNNSLGNINSSTVEWDGLFTDLQLSYTDPAFERTDGDFVLTAVVSGEDTITESRFEYNGTNYSTSIVFSGGNYLISPNIVLPEVTNSTNFSFNFYATLSSVEYDLFSGEQQVDPIDIVECTNISELLINISLYDEETTLGIVGDLELNLQIYTKDSVETVTTFNGTFNNTHYKEICLSPKLSYDLLYQDMEIRYLKDGYATEFYNIQRADLTDYPVNLSLYDLNQNDSTEFSVTYKNDDFIFTEGAIVQLQRKYVGEDIYRIVEAPMTGSGGKTTLHIDLNNVKYRASVVKDGELLDFFDNIVFSCDNELSGDCTYSLDGTVDPGNDIPIETITDFSYSISIDEDNQTITVLFAVPSGTPSSINVLLEQIDMFGNTTSCNNTIITSSGSVTCVYTDTLEKSIIELSISKNSIPLVLKSYVNDPELDMDGMNFFIAFLFMISLVGMAISSPEWMILISVMTLIISGTLLLLDGMNLVMGLGAIAWVVVAAAIILMKMSKQEDR